MNKNSIPRSFAVNNRLRWFIIAGVLASFVAAFSIHPPTAKGDEILVSAFFSDSIGRYDADSGTFMGNFESGTGLDGTLAARVGSDGLLYVASEGSNQIKRYNVGSGTFVDNFVTAGSGGLNGPTAITWDQNGDLLVASFNSDSVLKYNGTTGNFLETVVSSGMGGLNGPDNGTIIGPDGKLYIPSYYSNQIIRYDTVNNTVESFINGIGRPRVLVFQDDQLFITSESADAVLRYNLDGTFIDNFIQPGSSIMDTPVGLEYLNESWYVSSLTMDKVLKFDASGALIDANFIPPGSGGLNGPVFITGISSVPEPGVLLPSLLAFTLVGIRRRRARTV